MPKYSCQSRSYVFHATTEPEIQNHTEIQMVVGNPSLQPHPHIYCVNWYFITIWRQCGLLYSRGPQPPGCGLLLGHDLFRNKPHEQQAGAHAHACVAQLAQVEHIPLAHCSRGRFSSPSPQLGHQVANVEDRYFIVK